MFCFLFKQFWTNPRFQYSRLPYSSGENKGGPKVGDMLIFKYEQVNVFVSPNGFQKKPLLQQATNLCQDQASHCVQEPFAHLRHRCATWIGKRNMLCVMRAEKVQEEQGCRAILRQSLSFNVCKIWFRIYSGWIPCSISCLLNRQMII